ncbi:MAG: hypothetical protein ACYS7Y_20165 [Planctomycetota bacterium]|jgi:hypothetical protein
MSQPREVMIMRHDLIGAPHWYVTCGDISLQRKFVDIDDAKQYAKTLTDEEHIIIFD